MSKVARCNSALLDFCRLRRLVSFTVFLGALHPALAQDFELLNVLKQARANNFNTVVSARSGENEDSWLSDLATGWSAGQIKVGSTHGSERNAKWNRLLEFEAVEKTKFLNPFN